MAPKEPYRESEWADVSPLLKYISGAVAPRLKAPKGPYQASIVNLQLFVSDRLNHSKMLFLVTFKINCCHKINIALMTFSEFFQPHYPLAFFGSFIKTILSRFIFGRILKTLLTIHFLMIWPEK